MGRLLSFVLQQHYSKLYEELMESLFGCFVLVSSVAFLWMH